MILFDLIDHQIIHKWKYFIEIGSDYSFVEDFDLSQKGTIVSQKIATYSGRMISSATIHDLSTGDSIRFLQDGYKTAPFLNSTGLFSVHWILDTIVKLYKKDVLVNAFSGRFGGWLNDHQFVINKYKPTVGEFGLYQQWVGSIVFDTLGSIDSSRYFQENIFFAKTISDTEIIASSLDNINNHYWSVYNLQSGKKIFAANALTIKNRSDPLTTPIGTDYILYQSDTALHLYNWRQNQIPVRTAKKTARPDPNSIALTKGTLAIAFSLRQKSSIHVAFFTLNGKLADYRNLGEYGPGSHAVVLPIQGLKLNTYRTPLIIAVKAGSTTLSLKLLRPQNR